MRRARRLFLFGLVFVLALLAALTATMPARVAYRLAAPPPNVLACGGIHGTVWSGRARTCRVLGRLDGRLRWSVATGPAGLWDLLRLAPKIRFSWNGSRIRLAGTVVFSTPLLVRGLQGRIPLGTLTPLVPSLSLFGTPRGRLDLDGLGLDVGPGRLGPIRGSARLLDARLVSSPAVSLGDLTLTASADGRASLITARSVHARTLALDAHIRLSPHGAYRLTARLTALPDSPPALAAYLATLPPGPQPGSHLFTSAGVLPLPIVPGGSPP
jgi:hypothetical protein